MRSKEEFRRAMDTLQQLMASAEDARDDAAFRSMACVYSAIRWAAGQPGTPFEALLANVASAIKAENN